MGLYIAIDGGSSRSAGILASENLQVLHRAAGGCANYHVVGLDGAEKTLMTLIESLCAAGGVSPSEIERFCFALSGVSRPGDFRSIETILRRHRLHNKSNVISDAEAALLGGTSRGVGIVAISGTGSVVFGKNLSGKSRKISGHGHLIGDPGSGYDLGMRALRAILAAAEGRIEKTGLTPNVLHAISVTSEDDVVPWLYSQPDVKRVVASLAPTVIATASQEHDLLAQEILRSATEELAGLVAFTATSLDLTGQPFDVVLSGGVFLNNPPYFSLMQSSLSAKMPPAHPIRPENDPAFGALVSLLGRPASYQKQRDEDVSAPGGPQRRQGPNEPSAGDE